MPLRTITIRIDDETARNLRELRDSTGLSTSDVVRDAVASRARERSSQRKTKTPYQLLMSLALGPNPTVASSNPERRAVQLAIARRNPQTRAAQQLLAPADEPASKPRARRGRRRKKK